MNAEPFLRQTRERLETALDDALPASGESPEQLHSAMRYAVLGGGKRLRPALVLAASECCGGRTEQALPAAVAVELIHAYSLVHDDLPAMDDDKLRRGRPTCHIAFDEAMAILAGDALQTLALDVLLATPVEPDVVVRMTQVLARASGHAGMVGGQAIDMGASSEKSTVEGLAAMHRRKTGALIEASLVLGALSAGADERTLDTLRHFGDAMGLAFQVQDDILDVEGSTETIGKPQGSDSDQDKATYTALLGVDGARRRLETLSREAEQALDDMAEETGRLRALARFIVQRDH